MSFFLLLNVKSKTPGNTFGFYSASLKNDELSKIS